MTGRAISNIFQTPPDDLGGGRAVGDVEGDVELEPAGVLLELDDWHARLGDQRDLLGRAVGPDTCCSPRQQGMLNVGLLTQTQCQKDFDFFISSKSRAYLLKDHDTVGFLEI